MGDQEQPANSDEAYRERIRRTVDSWPPLNASQRALIAAQLAPAVEPRCPDDSPQVSLERLVAGASSPAVQAIAAAAPPMTREQIDTIRRAMGYGGIGGAVAITPVSPCEPKPEPQVLYRYYDECGCLLYVGITNNFTVRDRAHESDPWYELVARHQIEEAPDREAAQAAERAAIKGESPAFNIAGLGGPRASTARVHKWLIEHTRDRGAS